MNSWAICGVLAALAAGYAVGFQHGHDRTAFDARPVERIVYEPYPFAQACSDMLEAAWAIEAGSPHKE